MHSWVWEFVRRLIDMGQFGAIRGTCTTDALITMLHHWLHGTDKWQDKNFVQIVLLDYAKAFDHIDHNILMHKLASMNIPDSLLRWIEVFLMDRRQRVKIGTVVSDWCEIWGTVPQGTLLGVLCFVAMINDLQTSCTTIKYVDDTTIYNVTSDVQDTSLQVAVDTAIKWSSDNSMNINASKTKELLITYMKKPPNVPHITINGEDIERVSECKLLGVHLNDQLNWDLHIDKIHKKACQRLHFLSCLRRSNLNSRDMVRVFTSLIRPLVEYACQVWHPGLTQQQTDQIELVQERALKMIFSELTYEDALESANVEKLSVRRTNMCEKLFIDAQNPQHRLNHLLPPLRDVTSSRSHRELYHFQVPLVHTKRFRKTFINYGLDNKW